MLFENKFHFKMNCQIQIHIITEVEEVHVTKNVR